MFDAKLTQQNYIKKPIYFHAFSSKLNFESPLKTYLVINNVEEVIVNISSKKKVYKNVYNILKNNKHQKKGNNTIVFHILVSLTFKVLL